MGPIGEELKRLGTERDSFQLLPVPEVTPDTVVLAFCAGILLGLSAGLFA